MSDQELPQEHQGPSGTILDTLYREKPKHFWQRRSPATALEIAVASLQEAQRNILDHTGKAEYHKAMADMLRKREKRLADDIRRLSANRATVPLLGE